MGRPETLRLAHLPASEAELLEACRAGDAEAAAALVDLYEEPLLRTLLRLVGRPAVAEEIVQEAFLRMFESIERIDPAQGARRWLFGIAIHLARDYQKRGARQEISGHVDRSAPALFSSAAPSPEEQASTSEHLRLVDGALRKLSPKLREVIVLHYIEALSFPEIASILKIPVAALKVRAFRARARLRALLAAEVRS